MSNRRWGAAALLAVLLGLTALMLSRTVGVGATQEGDKTRADEKPKPGSKEPPARRADEAELRKTGAAFAQAFNKGDLEGLVSFWAQGAQFIRESGKTYTGRAAIRSLLKASLAENKGSKQTIKATSIHFVKSDVANVEGLVTITTPQGEVDTGRFGSVWIKQGGKWLISSMRDLPDTSEDDSPVATSRLQQLAWLVGEWEEKRAKPQVTMSVRWGPNQTYLIQRYTIKQADGKESQVTQRIGWDPQVEQIRTWLFDSSGGFGGGFWTRRGNTWEEEAEGVLPGGETMTSVNTWKFVDDKTMEWTSKEREVDEAPLPDLQVTFVRKDKTR